MTKKLKFLSYGIFLLFVFFVFSLAVGKDIYTSFDFDTTVRLQDNVSYRYNPLFSWFSVVGSFEIITLFLLALFLVSRKWLGILFVLPVYAVLHVIEIIGKVYLEHLPPPEFLLRTERVAEFPQFHVRLENSYPSGHAARTAFISIVLIFLLRKSKKLNYLQKVLIFSAIILFDFIMFGSRIYLGEHWATDVIGGALLGFSLAVLSLIFL